MNSSLDKIPVILAVDDKPELLTTITTMLQGKYKVIAVTSGAAALIAKNKTPPDLFLVDIEMPDMDGYELTKKIRAIDKFKSTPIIFLTAKATVSHVVSAVEHGGNDYIVKPVDKYILLDKIEHNLAVSRGGY